VNGQPLIAESPAEVGDVQFERADAHDQLADDRLQPAPVGQAGDLGAALLHQRVDLLDADAHPGLEQLAGLAAVGLFGAHGGHSTPAHVPKHQHGPGPHGTFTVAASPRSARCRRARQAARSTMPARWPPGSWLRATLAAIS
jgi:hypothetical protein